MKITQMSEAVVQRVSCLNEYDMVLLPFVQRHILFRATRTEWKQKLETRMQSEKDIYELENDHTNTESDFQCPRCSSFRTRYYPLQMRSADEPMAVLWECYACNKSGVQK